MMEMTVAVITEILAPRLIPVTKKMHILLK